MAKDLYIKAGSGGGGGVPTSRTLTINGTAQDLSADRTWSVGDMLTSTYDTDADGVVDSAERIQIVVRNSTGSTLTKGQIVYLSGATGNRPNALLAKADAEITSSKTIGMVVADIPNNTDGQIAVNGTLHDIDTSAFTAGDVLWLSATTAGGVVANTPPSEPNHSVFIGYVARVHPTQGRVVLAIQNGYELDELHGVQITSVANNDILKYNSSTGLWENSNALSSKQDTLVSGTNIKTINSSSILGSGNLTISGSSGKYVLTQNLNNTTVSIGTTYIGIGVGSTNTAEISRRNVVMAGNCLGCYMRITAAQTGTGVFTVYKNGSATSMTFTIANGSAAGVYKDVVNTFSTADYDELSIQLVQSTSTSARYTSFGLIMQST